jgi:hypothetical protein
VKPRSPQLIDAGLRESLELSELRLLHSSR